MYIHIGDFVIGRFNTGYLVIRMGRERKFTNKLVQGRKMLR